MIRSFSWIWNPINTIQWKPKGFRYNMVTKRSVLFAVLAIILLCKRSVVSDSLESSCDGSSQEANIAGEMDCATPMWTYGRYLYDIRFPSMDSKQFYQFVSDGTLRMGSCPPGTCFRFPNQTCVDASKWKRDCQMVNIEPETSTEPGLPESNLCQPQLLLNNFSCINTAENAVPLCFETASIDLIPCPDGCIEYDATKGHKTLVCNAISN